MTTEIRELKQATLVAKAALDNNLAVGVEAEIQALRQNDAVAARIGLSGGAPVSQANLLIAQLLTYRRLDWHKPKEQKRRVVINLQSFGGFFRQVFDPRDGSMRLIESPFEVFALFDILRLLSATGHQVVAQLGGLGSMAGIVLSRAADNCIVMPRCKLVITDKRFEPAAANTDEMRINEQLMDGIEDVWFSLLATPALPKSTILSRLDREETFWISAREAVELGIAEKAGIFKRHPICDFNPGPLALGTDSPAVCAGKARLRLLQAQAELARLKASITQPFSGDAPLFFIFGGEIDCSVMSFAEALSEQTSCCPNPVELFINSPGGSILDGYALLDTMNAITKNTELTTIGLGLVASMAVTLLQGASKERRIASDNSFTMVHRASTVTGRTRKEHRHLRASVDHAQNEVFSIIANASNNKLTVGQLQTIVSGGDRWYPGGSAAVSAGLADGTLSALVKP